MEHFSEEELVEMKNNVIKSHMQQRKSTVNSQPGLDINKKKMVEADDDSCNDVDQVFNRIPNEIMMKIFSYMKFTDLFACARVCTRWYDLIYDQSNWKKLNLSEWKKHTSKQFSI